MKFYFPVLLAALISYTAVAQKKELKAAQKLVDASLYQKALVALDEMQTQINKESGTDVEDGGIDMPDGGDGITRYPQDGSGNFISADDLEGTESDGVNNKGDNNGGN